MEKTNVMRILDQKKINYKSYYYGDTNAISGVEVADALNQDYNQVFKNFFLHTLLNESTFQNDSTHGPAFL